MSRTDLYHGAGYVSLVETWGSDERVIESARMSTDGAFRGWGTPEAPGDERLLRYLWTHGHLSPFEMAGAIVEVQVPIFVMRQIQRHRAASYNELSARYVEIGETFWAPTPKYLRAQPAGKGQGGAGTLSDNTADWAAAIIIAAQRNAFEAYGHLLSAGVCREQARAVLPLGMLTRCRMQANLRMWLHFLRLRLDPHAQEETRAVAAAVATMLRASFPRTMALFDEDRS
jgi:thymidylate synthase (FAD)